MKKSLFILVLATVCSMGIQAQNIRVYEDADKNKETKLDFTTPNDHVVCSYVEWYFSNPQRLNGLQNYVTNICFAFAELYVRDGVYHHFDLSGGASAWKLLRQVIQLKEKNPKLQVQVSFSHVCENHDNAQGGGFSAMAKSQEQLNRFAHDCKHFCDSLGIDGIDIDWELPGISWSGHACDPMVDTKNYTKMMKTLRDTLPFGQYLLTYAGYNHGVTYWNDRDSTQGWKYIDNMAIEPYVDWYNAMSYDMGEGSTPHNAINAQGLPHNDGDLNTLYRDLNKMGYPMHKVVIGIPFYGRVTFEEDAELPPTIDYIDIEAGIKSGAYTPHYNNSWQVPYIVDNKTGDILCSYDDTVSIANKAEWVKKHNMRGFMWWAQGGDNSKKDLTKACWNSMQSPTCYYQETRTKKGTIRERFIMLNDSTGTITDSVKTTIEVEGVDIKTYIYCQRGASFSVQPVQGESTGHVFLQWTDGNTDCPRVITANADATYTAQFGVQSALEEIKTESTTPIKFFYNGHLYIRKEGKTYSIEGREL